MTKIRTMGMLMGTFAAMTLMMLVLFLWSSYVERPWLHYQNLPFPVLAKAKAGEPVQLSVERCNTTNKEQSYDTTHTLTNLATKVDEILPNVTVAIKPGCHRGISKINVIPKSTKPGMYFVSGIATVPGAFVNHRVPWYSEPFEVM